MSCFAGGVLAILKNKKKFGFFSIANPVLSYCQYIFAHCFTSKLRKIKRKDKEIKKKLFDSEENLHGGSRAHDP